jgi:glutamate 5-kinase
MPTKHESHHQVARTSFWRTAPQVLLVTSGAVAFGKQLLKNKSFGSGVDPRASSAVGQGGLIATYDFMFQQYGIQLAQVCWVRCVCQRFVRVH